MESGERPANNFLLSCNIVESVVKIVGRGDFSLYEFVNLLEFMFARIFRYWFWKSNSRLYNYAVSITSASSTSV